MILCENDDIESTYQGLVQMHDAKFVEDLEFKKLILNKNKNLKFEEKHTDVVFDLFKNYQYYFPHNNLKKIIRAYFKRRNAVYRK